MKNGTVKFTDLSQTMQKALKDLEDVQKILSELSGEEQRKLYSFITEQDAFNHDEINLIKINEADISDTKKGQ
jgi:hypothetical protein